MKHKRARVGDKATYNGLPYFVHDVTPDALTLVSEDATSFVGVSRRDKGLRVMPDGSKATR